MIKKILRGSLLFIGGFLLMGTAHLCFQCENYIDGYVEPPEIIDDKFVEQAARNVEEAFLSGNILEITKLMSTETATHYADLLNNVSTEHLIAFGEAFKNRTLEVLSEIYAEYHFTYEGEQYSVALSQQAEDLWYLTRF
jgi:hypothetical protein